MKPLLALLLFAGAATLHGEEDKPAFDKFAKGNVTLAGNITSTGNTGESSSRTLRAKVTGSKTVPGPITVECLFILRHGKAYDASRSVGSAGRKDLPAGEGDLEFTYTAGGGQKILGWILRAYRGTEVVGAAAFPGKYEAAAAAQDPGRAVQSASSD